MNTVAAIVECSTASQEFKYYLALASGAQLEEAIEKVKAQGGQKTRLKLLETKRKAML